MLNHTITKLHKIAVEKKFSDLTQLNWRHGEKRKLAQHNMSHWVSMLGMQSTGGERRAKRGVSQLAVPHICFSIKTCFAAPLPPQWQAKRSFSSHNPFLFSSCLKASGKRMTFVEAMTHHHSWLLPHYFRWSRSFCMVGGATPILL